MKRIDQEMAGYRMPAYVEEILTENYCRNFMRMSIVRDSGSYSFSYKPGNCCKIDPQKMNLYDKLMLIRNIISISEESSDHLIKAESYLLEPELVYSSGGNIDIKSLKLMYYPDVKRLEFRYKIVLFADRIMNKNKREEREMAERIREAAEPGDMNRIKLFLDKSISRLENRMTDPPSSMIRRS